MHRPKAILIGIAQNSYKKTTTTTYISIVQIMLSLQFSPALTNYNNNLSLINPKRYGHEFGSRQISRFYYRNESTVVPRFPAVVATAAGERGVVALKDELEVESLPEGLQRELMPRHVAVIMDGNARWARQRGLPAGAGHEAGVRSLRQVVELCGRWGIKVLTVFAFSTDNWIRPKLEVDFLMSLFRRVLKSEMNTFKRQGIRLTVIGDPSKLSKSFRKEINIIEEETENNPNLHLMVAVNYSGKYDVVQACKTVAQKVKDGLIQLDDINEDLIEQNLKTNRAEDSSPDLLIRTSGELRISNFLLWQVAYSELFFAEPFWPDFGKEEFVQALMSYQQRQRRFGGRE